jgi:hypothetical protein
VQPELIPALELLTSWARVPSLSGAVAADVALKEQLLWFLCWMLKR